MGYLLNGVEDGGCPLHLIKKIIEGLLSDGAIPADMAPNSKYVNMYYTTHTVVRVNSRMTQQMAKLSHTRN